MTSAQLTAIIAAILTGLGGLGGVIKWGIGRITKSIDKSGDRIDRNTDEMIKNTASNAVLSTKIDSVALWVQRNTPGGGVPHATPKKARAETRPHVVLVDDDDKPED